MSDIKDLTSTVSLSMTAKSGRARSTSRGAALRVRRADATGLSEVTSRVMPPAAKSDKLRPSQLAAQLKGQISRPKHLTQIIELLNMSDYTHQTVCAVDVTKPIFEPCPTMVEFRHYNAFEPTEAKLSFRNNDSVPRRMRVIAPDSPFFSVQGPHNAQGQPLVDSRVAPGTELFYTVKFSPRDVDAYMYDLVCVTEREKFLVPLRAQGQVGVLSFPDSIAFPSTPVKSTTIKTFVVRNTGTRASEFALYVPGGFKVTPERGFVDVDHNLSVTIEYTPSASGQVKEDMVIAYADGFSALVELVAAGHDVDIDIDAHELAFPGTYTTLTNSYRVTLHNRSDIPSTFVWRACRTAQDEVPERARRLEALEQDYEASRQGILEAPEEDALDVDGDGVDDLSESDSEDKPPVHARVSRKGRRVSSALLAEEKEASLAYEAEVEASQDPFHAVRHMMGTRAPQRFAGTVGGQTGVNKRTQLEALRSRFRALAMTASTEGLDFSQECFSITPASGTVWSRSSVDFTITFAPNQAVPYEAWAFLELVGRSERLPLHLYGPAYGPKLTFTYDFVDIGDVFLTSKHRYEVVLLNKGEIAADWAIRRPKTPYGRMFTFEPSSGHIEVGASVPISVFFAAEALGPFEELFKVVLRGNRDTMKLQFKGAVVGPTFAFDVDSIHYGRVPFDFTLTRRFTLFNTSDVGFTYTLRVPQDGRVAITDADKEMEVEVVDPRTGVIKRKKRRGGDSVTAVPAELLNPPRVEFECTPSRATIAPGGLHNIQLDFTTQSLKSYDGYELTVDIDGVGHDILSVPIIADCCVATVSMATPSVSLGDVFVRYPYTTAVTLCNSDRDIPARFKVLPLAPHMAVVASVVAEESEGTIPAGGSVTVPIIVTAYKLGLLSLPVTVQIQGSTAEPLRAEVLATGRGPRVVPSLSGIDFGTIPALRESWRELVLSNESTINAPLQIFMRGGPAGQLGTVSGEGRFFADTDEAVLPPGGKKIVRVRAVLDDTCLMTDELVVNITESEPLVIPVRAVGAGSTLLAEPDFMASNGVVDLGQLFTAVTSTRTIVMENRGQRTQILSWTNTTQRMKEMAVKRAAKKKGGMAATTVLGAVAMSSPAVFTVEPAFTAVKPRQRMVFTITCQHNEPGDAEEEFELAVKAEGDIRTHVWAVPHICASFVQPLLRFSDQELHFAHEHSSELDEPDAQTGLLPLLTLNQPLTLSNVSPLPLEFTLRCQPPFSLDAYEFSLRPGEGTTVTVAIDPLYREDRVSHTVQGKITAVYREHPRKDHVSLVADLRFPNLAVSRNSIDFGCVLNDTTQVEFVQMTNDSALPVDFSWAFEDDAEVARQVAEAAGLPYVPINQVFDILPLRGHLEPGESTSVQFVFYGHPGRQFQGLAVCEVEGGPDYEVKLVGEASIASFRLDRNVLSMQPFLWDKTVESDFHIYNTSKVESSFSVSTESASRPGVLAVSPSSGVVPAGGRVRVRVAAKPGMPGPMKEKVLVSVAHFDPVEVVMTGEAVFAVVTADLPCLTASSESGVHVPTTPQILEDAKQLVHSRRTAVRSALSVALEQFANDPSVSKLTDPIQKMDVLGNAGKLNPQVLAACGAVLSRHGYNRAEGGVMPLAQYSETAEVEAEAARLAMAVHLQALVDAERRLANAEVAAGVPRAHPNLAAAVPDGGKREAVCEPEAVGGAGSPAATSATAGNGYESEYAGATDGMSGGDYASEEKKEDPSDASAALLGVPRQQSGGSSELVSARALFRSLAPPAHFAALHYVLDLGYIILGSTKKRTVSLTSAGRFPASVSFDKALAAKHGFTVDPGKIVRLPEGGSQDLDIGFTAQPVGASADGLGPEEVIIPLHVSKGPTVALVLRAHVTVPDVRISPDILDFGSVLKGQEKVMAFQLHNITPVSAQWEVAAPFGAPAHVKDKENFRFTPTKGTLQPGERALVTVAFLPEAIRPHQVAMPIRVTHNPKPRMLLVKGEGASVPLKFEMALGMDLFSVLGVPCPPPLEGNAAVGHAPVPAASASLDAAAASAAAPQPVAGAPPSILGATSTSSHVLVATAGAAPTSKTAKSKAKAAVPEPLIQIGPQLPAHLIGMRLVKMTNSSAHAVEVVSLDYDSQCKGEQSVLELLSGWDAKGELRVPARAPGQPLSVDLVKQALQKEPSAASYNGAPPLPSAPEGIPQVSEMPAAPSNSPRAKGQAVNILVLGPPGAGVSTQARAIGAAWNVPVVTLDDVLAWARSGAGGEAIATRLADATATAARMLEEDKAARAAKGAKVPKDALPLPEKPLLPSSIVAEVLEARMSKHDAQVGLVIDGLRCAELDGPSFGASAARMAFRAHNAGTARVISLQVLDGDLAKHYSSAAAALTTRIDALETAYQVGKLAVGVDPATAPTSGRGSRPSSAASQARPSTATRPSTSSPATGAPTRGSAWIVPDLPAYKQADGSAMSVDDALQVKRKAEAELAAMQAVSARLLGLQTSAGAAELSAYASSGPACLRILQGQDAPVLAPARRSSVIAGLPPASSASKGSTPEKVKEGDVGMDVASATGSVQVTDVLASAPASTVTQSALAALPRRPEEPNAFNSDLALPAPATYAVLKKPSPRVLTPEVSSKFRIVRLDTLAAALGKAIANEQARPASATAVVKGRPPSAAPSKVAPVPPSEPAPVAAAPAGSIRQSLPAALSALLAGGDFESMPLEPARWVLQPGETTYFGVRFASSVEGDFIANLKLGVVDAAQTFDLLTRGVCVYPQVDPDVSRIFTRKTRIRGDKTVVQQKFVQATGVYEFGAVLAGRAKKDRHVPRSVVLTQAQAQADAQAASMGDTKDAVKAKSVKGKLGAGAFPEVGPPVSPSKRKKRDPAEVAVERYFEHVAMGHKETLRITNNGLFPATLVFGLAGPDVVLPYMRGKSYVTKPEAPPDITTVCQQLVNATAPPVLTAGGTSTTDTRPSSAQSAGLGPAATTSTESAAMSEQPAPSTNTLEIDGSCFVVEPRWIGNVPVGATVEVNLWAFPVHGGDHKEDSAGFIHMNTLVAHVKDNPSFISVPISALAATPFLKLNGPWDPPAQPANESSAVPAEAMASTAAGSTGSRPSSGSGAPKAAAGKASRPGTASSAPVVPPQPQRLLAADGSVLLDFERTLVGHREDKTFVLSNPGVVPLVWRISEKSLNESTRIVPKEAPPAPVEKKGAPAQKRSGSGAAPVGAAPAESSEQPETVQHKGLFFVSPQHGALEPGATVTVSVGFGSAHEVLQQGTLVVEYTDTQSGFEGAVEPVAPAPAPAPTPAPSAPGGRAPSAGKSKAVPEPTPPAPAPPVLPLGFSPLYRTPVTVRAEAYRVQSGIKFDTEGVASVPLTDAERRELDKPTMEIIALTAYPHGKLILGWDGQPMKRRVLAGPDGQPLVDLHGQPIPAPERKAHQPGHFDFGVVRVNKGVSRTLPLSNDGKYPMSFHVGPAKADGLASDLFTCHPATGVLEAGQSVKVEVVFCAKKEVRLKQSKLLVATISDARSHAVVDSIPIAVTAESVFSRFSVNPSSGLNFGAIKYGTEKERRIEIRNVGMFPFDFNIVPMDSAEDARLLPVTLGQVQAEPTPAPTGKESGKAGGAAGGKPGTSAGKPGTSAGKPGSAKGGKPGDSPADGPLGDFGRFLIAQTTGSVAPGSSVSIPVKYVAVGAQTHQTSVRVHIDGFDYVQSTPAELVYELVGESCVPGINGSDWLGIFEEQLITDTLAALAQAPPMAPMAIAGSRKGHAGSPSPPGSPTRTGLDASSIMSVNSSFATLPGVGTADSAHAIALISRTRSGYATVDKTFSFGSVITTLHPKGVTERFKISNPTKIPVTVKFNLTNDTAGVYSMTPATADIGPHDSVFVTVRFTPAAVKKYNAVFSAEVEGGATADTRRMEFGLTGEGALPTATTMEPQASARDAAEGMLAIDLGKVQVSHAKVGKIVVRNDGVFPSVVKFELPFSRVFQLRHLEGGSEASHLQRDLERAHQQLHDSNHSFALGGADLSSTHAQDASNATKAAAGFLAATAVGGKLMSVLLQPGNSACVGVSFAPDMDSVVEREDTAPGLLGYDDAGNALYAADVRISVLHNPFEAERVRIRGTACLPDLAVENISVSSPEGGGIEGGGSVTSLGGVAFRAFSQQAAAGGGQGQKVSSELENTIVFPDLELENSNGATASFTLVNHSERPIRFQLPSSASSAPLASKSAAALATLIPAPPPECAHFTCSPQAGHLPIGGRKTITVTFKPSTGTTSAVLLTDFALPIYFSKVTYEPAVAEPASKERAALLAGAAPNAGRPPSASAKAGAAAARGGKATAPVPAAAAKGAQTAAKPGSAMSKPASTPGVIYTKRRAREAPAVREPRHDWDSNQTTVLFVPSTSQPGQAALADGSGELLQGGATVKVTASAAEPAYAVLEALPPVSADSAAAATPKPGSSGPSKGGAPSTPSKGPAPVKPASASSVRPGPDAAPAVVPVAAEMDALQTLPVPVRACADRIRCELTPLPAGSGGDSDGGIAASKGATFKPTLMFQTRVLSFAVKNPSAASCQYNWSVYSTGSAMVSDAVPFAIEPSFGTLGAGATQIFKAKFTPAEALEFDCAARMEVPNLSPGEPGVEISLRGIGQRPIVHLDLPASDYLSRRAAGLPGPTGEVAPLEAGIRVLEISSLGVGVRNVRRFYMVNPTDAPYDFQIEGLGTAATPASAIRCLTPKGLVLAGKRFEVVLEFTPVNSGVTEGFFRFSVPSHGLHQMILAAGAVSEPRVHLDRTSLSFKQLLVGSKGHDTVHLVNLEPVPFAFSFNSGGFDVDRGVVSVVPQEGVVPAGGRLALEVTLTPTEERAYNVSLSCTVKRMSAALGLNVKGEGYAIHDHLQLDESASASPSSLSEGNAAVVARNPELSAQGLNFLDFGTVQVNELSKRRIVITNNGSFSFDFHWSFAPEAQSQGGSGRAGVKGIKGGRGQMQRMSAVTQLAAVSAAAKAIKITPEAGRVPKGGSASVDIEFRPTTVLALQGVVLTCTVANTKHYKLSLSATGSKPSVAFEASELDFGDCFLPPSSSPSAIAVVKMLKITNHEQGKDVSLQCLWDNAAKPYLTVGLDALLLRAGESVNVPFTFAPRMAGPYQEMVIFEINGAPASPIVVKGEGVVPDIGLANINQAEVTLGAVRPGQTVTRIVKLTNKSKRGAIVEIVDERISAIVAPRPATAMAVSTRPPTGAAAAGDVSAASPAGQTETVGRLSSHGVTVAPTRMVIKARDTATFELKFHSAERLAPFKEPVFMRIGAAGFGGSLHGDLSAPIPLCAVSGAVLGMDLMLEADTLMFGKVCEGSKLMKSVQLYNSGDVPAKFRWDVSSVKPHYTIVPVSGFLSPHSDTAIQVIFHPAALGQDLRVEKVKLEVEGRKEPLTLTLTGDCVGKPTPTGAPITLTAKVRETATATITLPKNETDKAWTLTPVFSHEFFTGPTSVEVPAKSAAQYTVSYKPLLQTKDGGPTQPTAMSALPAGSDPVLAQLGLSAHSSTVFFALPDGSGMSYSLVGKASPGGVAGQVSVKTPAKKAVTLAVPVANLLRFTQRYVVSWDSSKIPAAAVLKGARTHDVPAASSRDYKLTCTPATEGRVTVPITFTSAATGEPMVYEAVLEAEKAGSSGTLSLESTVRQAVSTTVAIPNPLHATGGTVTFGTPAIDHPALRVIRVSPATVSTPEIVFKIEYRPLVPTVAGGGAGVTGSVSDSRPATSLGSKPGTPAGKGKPPATAGGKAGSVGAESASSTSGKVTLHSDQLGDYVYDLTLLARPPGPEPTLRFNAPLGGKQALLYRMRTFDGKATTYKAVCSRPDLFIVPATVTVPAPAAGDDPWEGTDATVEVAFEGLALGVVAAELTLTSDATGTVYVLPLQGTCTAPRPAGPYSLAQGGTSVVEFRNVFAEDKEFSLTADPAGVFTCTPTGVVKVAKKSGLNITVKYDANAAGGEGAASTGVNGRLLITCPSMPDLPPWVFYLKGEPTTTAAAGSKGAAAPAKKK